MSIEKQLEVLSVLKTEPAYALDDGRLGILYDGVPYELILNDPQRKLSIQDKIHQVLTMYEDMDGNDDIAPIYTNSLAQGWISCIKMVDEDANLFENHLKILM